MKYSLAYREHIALRDGSRLLIRSIQPTDKAALIAAFGRLSVESRRRRFFTTKNELSEQELRHLTECDGVNHYALVAVDESEAGESEGVGVARLVRATDDPAVAELAIAVVDHWQGRGVGTALLERIVAAAAERGIERIRAFAMADNEKIRALLRDHADQVEAVDRQGMLQINIPVPRPDHPDTLDSLLKFLGLSALGTILFPIWLGRRTLHQLLAAGAENSDDSR